MSLEGEGTLEPNATGWVLAPFALVGRLALELARFAGGLALLASKTLKETASGRVALRDVLAQIRSLGIGSLPLVIVTGALSGIVTSQQGGYQLTSTIPLYVLGSIVASSVILELGPVMTAIVVIGQVGARITAELGTMEVSEQMDALLSLGRDPVRVLVAPRIIAGLVSMPLLVGVADLTGFLCGMGAARATSGLGYDSFLYGARLYWHNWDLFYSLMKGTVFGLAIPLIASHMGLRTRGGAEGVGRSTTLSVVIMIVTVLTLDALFPPLFLN
jgi:phospholipid/cholesterol/gamma-HCH transport system permease protein